jgi:hypothetical protein
MDTNQLVNIGMSLLPFRDSGECHFTFIMDGKIIRTMGMNLRKTHTFAHNNGYVYPSIHAELDAFRKLPRGTNCSRLKMVNLRLSRTSLRTGTPILRMSKPCVHCTPWIEACGFKEVWYTSDDGWHVLN